jgi:hypothetical protein
LTGFYSHILHTAYALGKYCSLHTRENPTLTCSPNGPQTYLTLHPVVVPPQLPTTPHNISCFTARQAQKWLVNDATEGLTMHERRPFISRQIFEMACFRCQVLTYFTRSLLEVFGTLMSEYAPIRNRYHHSRIPSAHNFRSRRSSIIFGELMSPPVPVSTLRGRRLKREPASNPTVPANPPAPPKYSSVPGLGTMFCCTSSTRPYSPYKGEKG